MNLWILVIALFVIAIILFLISFFTTNNSDDLEEKLDDYTEQQSKELYAIKSRLAELEKDASYPNAHSQENDTDLVTYTAADYGQGNYRDASLKEDHSGDENESEDLNDTRTYKSDELQAEGQSDNLDGDKIDPALTLNDLTEDQNDAIIRMYSQGYTMQEISDSVNIEVATVQAVIDDYIENR